MKNVNSVNMAQIDIQIANKIKTKNEGPTLFDTILWEIHIFFNDYSGLF